jgi:hypothetical protein
LEIFAIGSVENFPSSVVVFGGDFNCSQAIFGLRKKFINDIVSSRLEDAK